MSRKDSSALKLKDLYLSNKKSLIYSNFRSQLDVFVKNNTFLIAVSGGPDSLALSALSHIYSTERRKKIFFVLIDHGIRKN